MKKYVLLVALLIGGLCSYSQDLDNIKKMILLNQFEKAKPDIDSYLSNEKNAAKPEGWYYKAVIYNTLGRDTKKTVAESKALYQGAFDALKKYVSIDTKAMLTTEEKNSTIYNIYYGNYDLGIKTYNDKNYEGSFENFKKAVEIHDYIFEKNIIGPNNLKFTAHDTDAVYNLAIIANTLNKKDDALVYYKRIADAGLGDEKYATAYDELVLKYKREKNAELFNKYITAAKKYYPVDLPYWETKEIEFNLGDLENEALLDKYEELTKSLPNNYVVFYNYAIEIDKFLSSDAAKAKDAAAVAAYRAKIEELFKKAVSLKSTVEGNLQLANLYYSRTYDLQERAAKIKGTKPAEVKAKADLQASIKSTMNEAIPYAEEGARLLGQFKEYKYADKANYKLAMEILVNAYKMNGNAAKLAEAEKKKAEVEKM